MENKFNFKSQICTDRFQSERLLALGLKKETADMVWNIDWCCSEDAETILTLCEHHPNQYFPAWSLHRLWELGSISKLNLDEKGEISKIYDFIIGNIGLQIKGGYFPKEYLE